MANIECILKQTLDKIAKEQEYNDYTTELTSITSDGANYTSQLYVVKLSASGKDDIQLFAKVAIIGENFRTMITLQIFEAEILFYTKILSKYRELEEKFNFPKEDRLILPKYYGGSTEYMKETLVLEELSVKGYLPFDRFKIFDWEYASKCIGVLAKFHALSVRYERDDPEEFGEVMQKLLMTVTMDAMKNIIKASAAPIIYASDEETKRKLEKFFQEYMKDEIFERFFNHERKITLNHSDFRPSNLMHKVNENGQLDVVLIDYQIIQKGNPVFDLLFFLISGSDEDFRRQYLEQYFNYYYEEFSRALRMLEINPDEVYRKEDYDADVKNLLPFGMMFAVMIMPVVTVDVESAPKPEDGIDLENLSTMKFSELFWSRFNGLVRDYVKLGIL